MPVTKTEAIKNFLAANTHHDLAELYNSAMEVQVNVAQDGGERENREFKGRQYAVYTDGRVTWKPIRIPLNANSDPSDNDSPMTFDLSVHAEGIGMTGWDWKARVSRWVGYDFDSIIGHATGLSDEDLAAVRKRLVEIPWVTTRKSTGGSGIHAYVFVPEVPTVNHTEHAALAKSILGRMSALAGFDFRAKIDCVGGNMWVWHRKMKGTDGLTLIKQGGVLDDIPPDWRDNVPVVTGKRRRVVPQALQREDTRNDSDRIFDELTGQQINVPLDADHRRLLDFLAERKAPWSWDADRHMLTCHTFWLKEAHRELTLKGPYDTVSTGRERQTDINCFMFPLRNGAWVVRRFGNGGSETATWNKDNSGYLRCYLNRDPDLADAAKSIGATEHKKGGYAFPKASEAVKAAEALGAAVELPDWALNRPAKLQKHKDGRLVVEIEGVSHDRKEDMPGWNQDAKTWHKIFDVQTEGRGSQEEVGNYDSILRHLVTDRNDDAGWSLCSDGRWRMESRENASAALVSLGVRKDQVTNVLGNCVWRPWTLVKVPFGTEYPGERMWNRKAPKLRYTPSTDLDRLNHPTWTRILKHCGNGLDDGVRVNEWCRANGVRTGADYLKCWIASLFQFPLRHLPYLFLYSREQNTGKSILGEALERVIVDGVMRAKQALMNQGGFNGELESMVLCTVEEGDLKGVKGAYEKVKEWVNSPTILIHPKGVTPYQAPNTSHWIQTSNDPEGCPIDPRDSRITMICVSPLDPKEIIPKEEMFKRLDKEAPDFLAAVLNLEIPPTKDRLNIPVVETEEKAAAQRKSMGHLELFLAERTIRVPGATIRGSEFKEEFLKWLPDDHRSQWAGRDKLRAEMPQEVPYGRRRVDSQWAWGNVSWTKCAAGPRLVTRGDKLVALDEVLQMATGGA